MMEPWLVNQFVGFCVFIFGTIIGSFLNVCIVRLPREKSVVFPGSQCVHCRNKIAWYDNIPLLSFIFLGGRCRHCHKKISRRYFVVELITGLIFLGFYSYFGFQMILLPYLVFVCGLIVATFVDIEHRIIPDEVSVGGMRAGIIFSVLIPRLHDPGQEERFWGALIAVVLFFVCLGLRLIYPFFCKHLMIEESGDDRPAQIFILLSLILIGVINSNLFRLPDYWLKYAIALSASLSGSLVGGGAVYVMGLLGDIAFKKESMGGGDVKLMAMVGAFLGWEPALLTFFIAVFLGLIPGIIVKIRTKESAFPFGPSLALGAVISLFWSGPIIHWIMSGYGLY